jgi:nucleoside-diphosphate-sugar epimerase
MRVFVTGASGHIASAVIPELLDNGHQVVGLARSDASAEAVAGLGAEVRRGDLDDLDGLKAAAAEADGVIHLAFKHEALLTGRFADAVDADMAATRGIGEALIATDKPFVTTGGTLMLAMAGITGRPGTEDDQSDGGPRVDAANYTISLAQQGVRSSVVRLAPMVHSELDHRGFTHALIGFARENGVAAYTGDGSNRWPAANTYDIGVLYRLALEKAPPARPSTASATRASHAR